MAKNQQRTADKKYLMANQKLLKANKKCAGTYKMSYRNSILLIPSILDFPSSPEPDKCWRIIERGGEPRANESRTSVAMVPVADGENDG